MEKFNEYREKYSEFIYKDYKIDMTDTECAVEYHFEIPGLAEFRPKWKFPKSRDVDTRILNRLVFSLGMVEVISYYKCVCPKVVNIECGSLSDCQKNWWKKLFYNGLGEFMYINDIDIPMDELVSFVTCDEDTSVLHDEAAYNGIIVPVGGGKDSVVSMELLKGEGVNTYHINDSHSIGIVIDVYNGAANDYYVKRTLDAKLIELNKEGYLNGHTPFSAIVAFSSVITAYLNGKKYIALSNETSANESTVKDSFVNHQYSKSFEFEQDFTEYFAGLTDSDIHYFSFLRALNELQIASLFAKQKKYYNVFRSCNVGSKQGIWCGNCPKCLFVFIIMSPFMSDEQLVEIFGKNMLDSIELENDFKELIGMMDSKPFECVGTTSEVCASLRSYIESGRKGILPEKYRDYIISNGEDIRVFLNDWVSENNIPEEYQEILKGCLKDA